MAAAWGAGFSHEFFQLLTRREQTPNDIQTTSIPADDLLIVRHTDNIEGACRFPQINSTS